jgi:hypothetical protein
VLLGATSSKSSGKKLSFHQTLNDAKTNDLSWEVNDRACVDKAEGVKGSTVLFRYSGEYRPRVSKIKKECCAVLCDVLNMFFNVGMYAPSARIFAVAFCTLVGFARGWLAATSILKRVYFCV